MISLPTIISNYIQFNFWGIAMNILLKDGASLPISRGYKQSARDAFFASLRRPEDAL